MTTFPKIIAPEKASSAAFRMLAKTDPVARTGEHGLEYAEEIVRVDPCAPIENDCLVVVSVGGSPHLIRIELTGRNEDGQVVPAGDPTEVVMTNFGWYFTRDDSGSYIHGRLVGYPRQHPRPLDVAPTKGGAQ